MMDLMPKSNAFQIPHYILNDLCTRFIINIPDVESRDIVRVFFQIELAHWFYLDFYCPDNSELRTVNLKEFASQMFVFCPTLSAHIKNFDSIFESWKEYKQTVPTYGGILLDPSLQYCLLVQGFLVKSSWGFPKGKVNQDERPVDCAVREVLEETGFDTRDLIDENEYLEYQYNDQLSRLYIIPNVSRDTHFEAKTRQEIRDFHWFRIDHLPSHKKDVLCKQHLGLSPNSFFMVIPFVKELKLRISQMLSRSGSGRGQRLGQLPAIKSQTDIRQSLEKKRQKQQQQQFSQHMHQELHQDLVQHKDSSSLGRINTEPDLLSAVLVGAPAAKSVSPRQAKWTNQTNTATSPVKKSITKPPKILKREVGKQGNTESQFQGNDLSSEFYEDSDGFDFSCPIWTNFRLDVEQILNAMLPPKCD